MMPAAAGRRLTEGNPNSAVRLVIFEDLQCRDCAAFRDMMDQKLLPRYGDWVAFEHRDFPLTKHSWARPAAIAARFFESVRPELGVAFRREIMGMISKTTAENLKARLEIFALENRVSVEKVVAALSDQGLAEQVESDFQEGVARGISKTPTVLVNGEPSVETFTFEEISKAIDGALDAGTKQ
jgi:protein-disulfide isomerase